jgi:hypothetical protein
MPGDEVLFQGGTYKILDKVPRRGVRVEDLSTGQVYLSRAQLGAAKPAPRLQEMAT